MNILPIPNIAIGIIIGTISALMAWFFRSSILGLFKFLGNRFKQLRLSQSEHKFAKQIWLLSEEFKKRLKFIVDGFSNCLDYDKTCSLLSLIQDIQELHPSAQGVLSFASDEASLLKDWYAFYKGRFDSVNSPYVSHLFNEFGSILIRLRRIFEKVIKGLDEDSIRKLKMDSYGYPLFKQIFTTSSNEFSKLTEEASRKLKGVRKWSIITLPEL